MLKLTYTVMKAEVQNRNRAVFTANGIKDAIDKFWGRESSRPIVIKKQSKDEQTIGYVMREHIDFDEKTGELRLTLPAKIVEENGGSYIIPILNVEKEFDRRDGSIVADLFVIGGFLLTTTEPAFEGIDNKIQTRA